jgi:hypothetical protein
MIKTVYSQEMNRIMLSKNDAWINLYKPN